MANRILYFAIVVALISVGCSDREPLDGAHPGPRLDGAVELGRVSPDTVLDLVIGVRLRDAVRLHKFLDAQDDTRDSMSSDDFADAFAASAGRYARLLTWLRAQGLTIVRTAPGRTSVSARGSARAVERAFGAELHQFEDGSGRFVASVTALTLSPDVAPSVSGVVGVEGGLPWLSHMVRPQVSPQAAAQSFGATDLETQYGSTGTSNPGQGETVVILGAGNAPATSDVQGYYTTYEPYGLTAPPAPYNIHLVGGANRDGNDIAELERQENTLDIEMVSAIAPYADVEHVLTATNTPGLFADGIAYIVNQLKDAHAVTVSYGTCERGAASYMPVVHAMLAQAKAQGQTWFFASGDSGSDGCRSGATNKILSAGWPASAPFAVGVGGTQINSGSTEVVWNSYPGSIFMPGGGGGGGVSESLDKPAFQLGVTPDDGARDEPDVAALAGAPYINIYIAGASPFGNTTLTGGTSAAAPVWAGVWALLEQSKGHTAISNSLEGLYALGKVQKGFHDVVGGNLGGPGDTASGGYAAAAGYDLATGWGTPNAADLIASWQ